jgi:formamidopyrimidine-DNA glycosylase
VVPELPEVETIARDLRARIVGARIARVELSGKPLRQRRRVDRSALERALAGHRIEAIDRRAKYLLVGMSSGETLLVHLGMSGRLALVSADLSRAAHTHAVFALEGGADELRFVDPRRFGTLVVRRTDNLDAAPELRGLGLDPTRAEFTAQALYARLRGTRGCDVKAFLLDQRRLAGVGNIYASEALYGAQIHPRAIANSLSRARARRLADAVRHVLERAVESRGTTFRDYLDAQGWEGENQHNLQVFMRDGQPCYRCGAKLRRIVQQARSTYYCPCCQR